jgi:hypothetical protein
MEKLFLSSPNHHNTWILLQAALILPLKFGLKGTCFTAMEDIKLNVIPKHWKIPNKPSAGASNIDRIDGASACAQ